MENSEEKKIEIIDPETVTGSAGIEMIGRLLEPISEIVKNEETKRARSGGMAAFAAAMMKNSSKDVLELLSVLTGGADVESLGAFTMTKLLLKAISLPSLREAFGLQAQTPTSSVSAFQNIEAGA